MRRCFPFIGLLLALLSPLPASAVTLFVSPDGDGAFIVEGENINDAESIEITVNYNTAILANPRVSLQGGTVTNIFAGIPGTLTFDAYRGDDRTASFEAHLTFEKKGDSPGGIISVAGTARDTRGKSAPAGSSLNLPIPPSATPPASEPGSEAAAASPAGAAAGARGDGGEPEAGAGTDATSSAKESPTELGKETMATPGETESAPPIPPGDMGLLTVKSVLERFKEYDGKKELKELTALFEHHDGNGVAQEPPIALSDGKTPIRITVGLQLEEDYSPNFALSDAKFISLRRAAEKSWGITAIPKGGTWKASLMLGTGRGMIEIPLVVAPPVKIQQGTNEDTFLIELKKYLAEQAAACKGENTPFQQYLYEYVFTANYLAKMATHTPKPASK